MSGILGLIDPSGPDRDALARAADAASYRGDAQIRSFGPALLGIYARPPRGRRFVVRSSSVLVADARVDAPLPGTVVERLSRRFSDEELLDAALEESGPASLDGVAADFALARWDSRAQQLLLARDAFGLRPLFWARKGSRVGFAPDPAVLIALGLVGGDLEFDVVASAVAGGDPVGEVTAFAEVNRVRGGHWITFGTGGDVRRGRWFRPESIRVCPSSPREAVPCVREAVVGAVASRADGERVAIALSGGRDSGAVAAAARFAGVTALCFTEQPNPDAVPSEVEAARALADAMDHPWRVIPIGAKVTLNELLALPDLAGSPIGFPSFPGAFAMRKAASATGATLVIDGEGGDPLFSATPAAVVDLARGGRPALAWRAAKAFRNHWKYSYPVIGKVAIRTVMPQGLLELRERVRSQPSWVVGSAHGDDGHEARSAHEATVSFLLSLGGSSYLELAEQMYQRAGLAYACPLYDQRVVRVALALPLELRIPHPQAKPVLSTALLGNLAATRVKAYHTPYFTALASGLHADFPWLFESDSLCARQGFVRGPVSSDERWITLTRNVVPTEMWVRRMEGWYGGVEGFTTPV